MAAISLTYTLSNGTTADASQVMQNFNDIVNGTSDGTKDFSINALTCAGAATLNGNVTLGNATSDTVTATGRFASNIVPSASTTYDLGTSSLGFAGLYLGDGGSETVRIEASGLSANRIARIPDAGATASFVMTEAAQTINGTKTFGNVLLFADGDATTPGLGFSGDTNTGIYRVGSDQLGFTTAGAFSGSVNAGLWTLGTTSRHTHVVNGRLQFSTLTDSSSSGTLNNYAIGNYGVVYFSNASSKTLTGIAAPSAEGTVIWVFNSGGTLNVNTLDGSSSAANQIETGTGTNIAISSTGGLMLIYVNSNWRVFCNNTAANTY